MEFLDINFAEEEDKLDNPTEEQESKPEEKEEEGKKDSEEKLDNTGIVTSVLEQALDIKEPIDANQFVDSLDEEYQKTFREIMKSRTSGQERALVTALMDKYPKLKEEKHDTEEFKAHVENMLEAGKLEGGALRMLFSLILTGNEDGEVTKEEPAQPENEDGQPEAEEPEGNEEAVETEQEGGAMPQDSNNSDMTETQDFYDKWSDLFNDDHTDMTEDDFADLYEEEEMPIKSEDPTNLQKNLVSNTRATSEAIKEANEANDKKRSEMKEFVKRYHKDMSGIMAYYSDDSDEELDREFSKVDKLKKHATATNGLLIGALLGGLTSLGKGLKTKMESKDFRKLISQKEEELISTFNAQQLKEYKIVLKMIKGGKYLNTIHSYFNSKKNIFTGNQVKAINEIIVIYSQLRADEKGMGFSKFIGKTISGAISGWFIGLFAELVKDRDKSFSDYTTTMIAEDFLVEKLYADYEVSEGGDEDLEVGGAVKIDKPYNKDKVILPKPLASESNLKNMRREKEAIDSHPYLSLLDRKRLGIIKARLKEAKK